MKKALIGSLVVALVLTGTASAATFFLLHVGDSLRVAKTPVGCDVNKANDGTRYIVWVLALPHKADAEAPSGESGGEGAMNERRSELR
jgi:hypothetical protein